MSGDEKKNNLVTVVPGKSDAELAQEFREEARTILESFAELATRAKAHGLIMGFNMAQDSFGRQFRITEITVVKPL